MADATVSIVVEQLLSIAKQQIEKEIQLVRDVDKELDDLSRELTTIRNVLDDAERRQFADKTVKDWLWRLEQTSYEMEDVLEEWNYAILKHTLESEPDTAAPPKQMVCSFLPSFCFSFKKLVLRRDIAMKVKNLKSRLDEILKEKDRYNFAISQPHSELWHVSRRVQSTSLIDLAEVQGRSNDRDILVSKLSGSHLSYQIVSIVGAGGLGKTTLAQQVYNHSQIKECFDFRIWLCVSDPFDVAVIAKGIIKGIDKKSYHDATQLDALFNDLIGCTSMKKILLVLDDVWNGQSFSEKWKHLENALKCHGSTTKILVTTRDERVAKIMGTTDEDILRPGLLSDEECWLLLSRSAFSEKSKSKRFEEIGKAIAKKCNGLPLAAKTLGSLLRFKNTPEELEKILKSEMWGLKEVEVELFPHLLLSYHELSPTLKRCFSFCAFFPKDKNIKVEKLIRMWMAFGYLGSTAGDDIELEGRENFEDLAMRSLFQDFEEDGDMGQIMSCKMHDIVHDFAQFLRKASRTAKSTCQDCDPNLVSYVKEYRGLSWDETTPPNICDCLTSLRVLKFGRELNDSPLGMEKLIHLRWLDISKTELSKEGLQTICQLYFLQTLLLANCSLEEIPGEIRNLVHLRYLDLSFNKKLKELPESICSLYELRTLLVAKCSLKEIPREIGNLVHLRHFDLSENKELEELPESMCCLYELQTLLLARCNLKQIPSEIGNLVHLRHLNLCWNIELKELPKSMCSLYELQTLLVARCSLKEIPMEIGNLIHLRHIDLAENEELKELPESMCCLYELQTLDIEHCTNIYGLPQRVSQLTGLRTLNEFRGGSGCNKLGLLKNLNRLSGSLTLKIKCGRTISDLEELVEDAQEAELRNKIHLQWLHVEFLNNEIEMDDENDQSSISSLWVDVIEALQPNHNLKQLTIDQYEGWRLPHWISLPYNLVRDIELCACSELSSLPPLGKLPFLESLRLWGPNEVKFVGREWLGISEVMMNEDILSSSSATNVINVAFPKLKCLAFRWCSKWEEWEDITVQEEESRSISIMPCLTELKIRFCGGLKKLPHRLLSKVECLKELDISGSAELQECYGDKEGSPWRSISQIHPQLRLVTITI